MRLRKRTIGSAKIENAATSCHKSSKSDARVDFKSEKILNRVANLFTRKSV